MILNDITDDETSNTDSDSKDSTEQSNFNETNDSNELDDTEIEPPVFDTTKENDYNIKYKQSFEEVTNLDDVYILDLDAQTYGQSLTIAAALSNFTCKIYNLETGGNKSVESVEHGKKIIGVKLDSRNITISSSLMYTGSEDGTIKLWDFRLKNKCVSVFKDDTDSILKPLSCFDLSCDGRFLVAGTEVLSNDAFLLFWDIRSRNILGGYWDSHQEDITQVKFHPTEEKTVISGSTDGIINLFDVTQTTEKDALQLSLNTNSSVSKLKWLKNKNEDFIISCITHTEDVQLWHTIDSSPYVTIPRDVISSSMNVKPDVYSQVIDCHQTDKNGNIMILVGNNYGKGEHLQSLDVNNGTELLPRTLFNNNKQIIRCSWYDYDSGTMITGGEAGILNVWIPSNENDDNTTKCSFKVIPKANYLKNRISKPY